ncbi:MAG: NADH-quinone oxidoreductase subunit C [Deltaproteobacteria bacterium]|nr:NADH-quinone oxidoreductase subunit C [Deltaproteobacteria bacterium]
MSFFVELPNASALPLAELAPIAFPKLRQGVLDSVVRGDRLVALFGIPQASGRLRLVVILGVDATSTLRLATADVEASYEAFTPECPPAHWFERELAEQWGVVPRGHPWLKPIRFHRSMRPGTDAWLRPSADPIVPGVTDFFAIQGDEPHEVAVGPVHAGVIEPGHFRFQCHGEKVLHLEISLGYQHRGVERALVGGPHPRSLSHAETLAGDTSIGHATAYCQVLEALAGVAAPPRADALRAVMLELERLANHTGDLGALAGDVGYLPTASFCGRLRGDYLNVSALVCGSRFGRGMLKPGGVRFDLGSAEVDELGRRLEQATRDLTNATTLLWETPTVLARFEETGVLTPAIVDRLGLVGPPARACGLERDVRFQYPTGMYRFAQVPVSTWHSGDVFARAYVRWLECRRAATFVGEVAAGLPSGPCATPMKRLAPEKLAVALVETWRGEAVHVAVTDSEGRFAAHKVVDPSFHNWMGLAMALRGQEISDFPLCNKSFNLSYCGHDL